MHQLVKEYGTFSDLVSANNPRPLDAPESNISLKGEVVVSTYINIEMIIAEIHRF